MKFVILSIALLLATNGWAELPPSAYLEMQEEAPELLKIEVLTVSKKSTPADRAMPKGSKVYRIRLEARVLDVERSDSRLKKGDTIRIAYTRTERPEGSPWVGPSEIPLLKKGEITQAYLGKGKASEVYSPVARGRSFQTLEHD